MKLKIGDKVYLQKYEVAYIDHELELVPASIFEEMFHLDDGSSYGYFSINGADDGHRFAVCFKKPESVKWLMEQDWIVDYSYYEQMSAPVVLSICWKLETELHERADALKGKPEEYQKAREELSKLDHQIWSLHIMADHLNGKLDFQFPAEMPKKPANKKGFFARLFGRSAH